MTKIVTEGYKQAELKTMFNGLIKCPINDAEKFMPEVSRVLNPLREQKLEGDDWYVDVKIHMLMPNQWPCIPNWHSDLVPRDEFGALMPEKVDQTQRMYLWLSGPPYTVFFDERKVEPNTWIEFDQLDVHRGTMSEAHQWRMFIRVAPGSLVQRPNKGLDVLRRHTQVYLDSKNFTW